MGQWKLHFVVKIIFRGGICPGHVFDSVCEMPVFHCSCICTEC